MIKQLICKLFGHDYYVYAKPKEAWCIGVRWLKCDRCHRDFAMNANVGALLPMSPDLEDMHEWQRL